MKILKIKELEILYFQQLNKISNKLKLLIVIILLKHFQN